MLYFYEKKGHKYFAVSIIVLIVGVTFFVIVQKYISINHDIAKMKELQDIAEKTTDVQYKKSVSADVQDDQYENVAVQE